jgi:hypothetical protein
MSMSRASLLLIIVLLAVVAGLVALGRRPASVPLHHIEKPVTLGGDGAQG